MAHRTRDCFKLTLALAALGIAASAAAQTASTGSGHAYPAKPIRLVVAQSTGGNADFVARAYSQRLAERFGQQIVVDNRPGGAGIIGTEIVARAKAKPGQLNFASSGMAAATHLAGELFNPFGSNSPPLAAFVRLEG